MEPKHLNRELGIAGVILMLLLSLGVMIPSFTVLGVWLLPAPIITFAVLQSRTRATMLCALVGFVLFFTGFGWFAILLAGALYFLTWAIEEILSTGKSPFIALILLTLVFIMLELVLLAIFRLSISDLLPLLKTEMSRTLAEENSLLGKDVTLQQVLALLKMMFPALVSIIALLMAAVNVLLLRWLLRAKVPTSPILRNWRLPYSVLLVYLLSLALIMLNAFHQIPWLWQSLQTVEFVGSFVIGIEGLSFIWRKLQSYRSRYFILVLLILATMIPLVTMIYVMLGALDILNEIRRQRQA